MQHSNRYISSYESNSTVYPETTDEFESLNAYLSMQTSSLSPCKPFRIELLYEHDFHDDWDVLERFQQAKINVSALLANMPLIQGDDLQQRIDLLLGPSTVESVRYAVEVGAYLVSNHIRGSDNFIAGMLQIVPWTVLKLILSISVSTIQAFAEFVLWIATRLKNIRIVKDLLQNPRLARILRTGKLLVTAVETSNAMLVHLLLHAGARADWTWGNEVPLIRAKTVEIARLLVEAGADVNATGVGHTADGRSISPPSTALSVAIMNGDVKLARYLISAGADVNKSSICEGTPLESAARRNHRELLELLLKQGAHVDPVHERIGALQYAAIAGDWNIVRLLVEAGADVNAPAYWDDEMTALEAATFQGHVEMVTFLLNHGADVNASKFCDHLFPKTVLTTAVEENHLGLVELLLNAGADVNMPSYGYYGCTALETAKSRPASSEIVNLLIAKGASDVAQSLNNLFQRVQLFKATRKGDFDRVQFLVNLGVQIDMQAIDCHLLKDYVDESDGTTTILNWALGEYNDAVNVELFRFLVDKVEHVNAQEKASVLTNVLVKAISRQNVQLVEILIDAGADVNGVDRSHRQEITPLMRAAGYGNSEIVHSLLRKGADINATVKGYRTTTALQESLMFKKLDIFYLLLTNGAKTNAPIGSEGSSELAYAAATGSIQVVRELLDRGAEINPNIPDEGQSVLQAAAGLYTANTAMVQLLLERGADVNAPGRLMALQAATEHGHFQIALLLLEAGADVNAQALEGYRRPHIKTALETAAYRGRLDILHLLLKAGADMHLPITKRYVRAAALARSWGHNVIANTLERWEEGEEEEWEEAEEWEEEEGWGDWKGRVEWSDDWNGWENWEKAVEWEDGENWEKWKKWKKWGKWIGWEKWEQWETWEDWKAWHERENPENNGEDRDGNSRGKEGEGCIFSFPFDESDK